MDIFWGWGVCVCEYECLWQSEIYRAMKCDEAKFWDVQTHIAVSGVVIQKKMGNWIESMIGLFLC